MFVSGPWRGRHGAMRGVWSDMADSSALALWRLKAQLCRAMVIPQELVVSARATPPRTLSLFPPPPHSPPSPLCTEGRSLNGQGCCPPSRLPALPPPLTSASPLLEFCPTFHAELSLSRRKLYQIIHKRCMPTVLQSRLKRSAAKLSPQNLPRSQMKRPGGLESRLDCLPRPKE